jgi:hypothetical protein
MPALTVATLQQSLFALHQGFMQVESIRVILEEGLQENTFQSNQVIDGQWKIRHFTSSLLSALCAAKRVTNFEPLLWLYIYF